MPRGCTTTSAHWRPSATSAFALCSAYTTNSKSPNSFRAFSRLPAAPVLAGLRGFASRALLFPFRRFFALHGLSVLRFYLYASRACARPLLELMRVSGRSVVVGNSCSGGDRSLPLHQVQASENAFFTLEPAGWPIHPARPLLPVADRPVSVGSRPVTCRSASCCLERPLPHPANRCSRPNPASRPSPERPFSQKQFLRTGVLQSGRWWPLAIGQLQSVANSRKRPFRSPLSIESGPSVNRRLFRNSAVSTQHARQPELPCSIHPTAWMMHAPAASTTVHPTVYQAAVLPTHPSSSKVQ